MSATKEERAAAVVAARRIGIDLPSEVCDSVAANLRLLERHRAVLTEPRKP